MAVCGGVVVAPRCPGDMAAAFRGNPLPQLRRIANDHRCFPAGVTGIGRPDDRPRIDYEYRSALRVIGRVEPDRNKLRPPICDVACGLCRSAADHKLDQHSTRSSSGQRFHDRRPRKSRGASENGTFGVRSAATIAVTASPSEPR